MFNRLVSSRFGLIALLTLCGCVLFFLLRTAFLINNLAVLDLRWLDLPLIYGVGLLHDFAFLGYLLAPMALYLTLLSNRRYQSRAHHYIAYALALFVLGLITFDLVAEWLFWDEFQVRFNFISVDYLVYRREVTGNISESYPVVPIFSGIGLVTLGLFFALKPLIDRSLMANTTLKSRLNNGLALLAFPFICYFALNSETFGNISNNNYKNELAKNGPYQFFHAFWHNELDYEQFYKTGDVKELSLRLRNLVQQPHQQYQNNTDFDLLRQVQANAPERKLNIMMIVVESLSGDYLANFGNQEQLTPHLDALADKSLFFTRFYATGNRTVRGMEALTLSIPPTPGQSVVHRPHNENLFSLGHVLRDKGYDTKFIYGGYGYFDNMNYFFGHNGFDVVDRTVFADDEITFGNIWGVSDEYLFLRAMREADKSYAAHKPFYSFVMTTSNHRPYTFPKGRIDGPQGKWTSAVRYTDYAINKLLEDAKTKPWFNDTVFVIVADHCAGSAGKSDLPLERYHIPLWIYAPKYLSAKRVEQVSSQIDVAPTLLGLLNMSYQSRFFGKDIFQMQPEEGRALLGTYQKVALYDQKHMVILSPNRKVQLIQTPNDVNNPQSTDDTHTDEALVKDTLAYYQGASYQLHHDLMSYHIGLNH